MLFLKFSLVPDLVPSEFAICFLQARGLVNSKFTSLETVFLKHSFLRVGKAQESSKHWLSMAREERKTEKRQGKSGGSGQGERGQCWEARNGKDGATWGGLGVTRDPGKLQRRTGLEEGGNQAGL